MITAMHSLNTFFYEPKGILWVQVPGNINGYYEIPSYFEKLDRLKTLLWNLKNEISD